jgi:hypothetical protein
VNIASLGGLVIFFSVCLISSRTVFV